MSTSGYYNINGSVYYNGTDLSSMNWSEVTGGEWFAIACLALSTLLCLITTILLIIKRDYPPLKAKQVPLQIICGISAAFCQIGLAAQSRLFPERGVFLLDGGCYSFDVWFLYILGGTLFCDTFIFSLLRLYFIFNLRRMPSTVQQIFVFLSLWIYPFVYGIAVTAAHANGPKLAGSTGFDYPICYFSTSAEYSLYVYFGVLIILFIYLSVSLRNIPRKAFAEYQMNRNLFIYFLIIYVAIICIVSLDGQYHPWGRIVIVLLIILALDVVFIGRVLVPLYHSLVDPEEYRAIFLAQMNNSSEIKAAASKVDLSATTQGRKSKRSLAAVSSASEMNTSNKTSINSNENEDGNNEDRNTGPYSQTLLETDTLEEADAVADPQSQA